MRECRSGDIYLPGNREKIHICIIRNDLPLYHQLLSGWLLWLFWCRIDLNYPRMRSSFPKLSLFPTSASRTILPDTQAEPLIFPFLPVESVSSPLGDHQSPDVSFSDF